MRLREPHSCAARPRHHSERVVVLYLAFLCKNKSAVIVMHSSIAAGTLGLSYIWLHSYGIAGVGLAWLIVQTMMAVFLSLTHLRPILKREPAVIRSSETEGPAH
jgi:hypothetical protein